MQKALTQMNVQLANVISDLVGETGPWAAPDDKDEDPARPWSRWHGGAPSSQVPHSPDLDPLVANALCENRR